MSKIKLDFLLWFCLHAFQQLHDLLDGKLKLSFRELGNIHNSFGRDRLNVDTMNNTSKTDWERIDAMRDEDIDTSDIPQLSADFWAKAQLRTPKQITTSVQIDPETFAWFQSQGENAARQMSVALKIYAESHKSYVK